MDQRQVGKMEQQVEIGPANVEFELKAPNCRHTDRLSVSTSQYTAL